MSRTYLYQALVQDANSVVSGSLGDLGIKGGNVYAGEVDSPEGDAFLILRFGPVSPGIGPVNIGPAFVWAYRRDSADYLELDVVLKRIRDLFTAIEAQATAEGWITEIVWLGDSDDFSDDVYHAVARNASFTIVASGR